MPSVFLSHSSRDKPFVRNLAAHLRQHPEISVWLDETQIAPGANIVTQISAGLDSEFVLFILSPDSVNSRWVAEEFDLRTNHPAGFRQIATWLLTQQPAPPPRINPLPTRPPLFIGRESDLAFLHTHLQPGVVLGLSGMHKKEEAICLELGNKDGLKGLLRKPGAHPGGPRKAGRSPRPLHRTQDAPPTRRRRRRTRPTPHRRRILTSTNPGRLIPAPPQHGRPPTSSQLSPDAH